MRHIMVATDGSEGADRAVDVAAELAKAFGGELLIVTVGGNVSGEEMRQLERAERNIGEALDMLSNQIMRSWLDGEAGPIGWLTAWKRISKDCEPRPVHGGHRSIAAQSSYHDHGFDLTQSQACSRGKMLMHPRTERSNHAETGRAEDCGQCDRRMDR